MKVVHILLIIIAREVRGVAPSDRSWNFSQLNFSFTPPSGRILEFLHPYRLSISKILITPQLASEYCPNSSYYPNIFFYRTIYFLWNCHYSSGFLQTRAILLVLFE